MVTHIVVRAPNWLGDVAMSLPFIHELACSNPHSQLHIILKKEHELLLRLLPSHVSWKAWHFDKKHYGNPFKLQQYCKKMRRDLEGPVSQYYCLPPSFSAALMGWFLGAEQRVGYQSQGRSFLFTKARPRPQKVHRSQEYWGLLDHPPSQNINLPSWSLSHIPEIETPFKSYLVINPNSQASSRRLPLEKWAAIASMFKGQSFAIVGSPAEFERVEALKEILEARVPQNKYINMAGKTSVWGLVSLLKQSHGLISNDSGPAHLAHFIGVPTIVFFGAGDPHSTGPFYARGRAMIISKETSCAPCLKNKCPLGTLACLEELDFHDWEDRVLRFFSAESKLLRSTESVDKVVL